MTEYDERSRRQSQQEDNSLILWMIVVAYNSPICLAIDSEVGKVRGVYHFTVLQCSNKKCIIEGLSDFGIH